MAIALLFIINNMVGFGQVKQEQSSFSSFEVEKIDHKILLNWTINAVGTGNYFEVERSFDGKNFKTIMVVLGPDPSIKEKEKFEGIDKTKAKNKAYYRLKHINEEGVITFSSIKSPVFNQ